jgi:uncharacterized protein
MASGDTSSTQPIGAAPVPPATGPSAMYRIFMGPKGLRAGWRILIFILLFAALAALVGFILAHIKPLQHRLSTQGQPKRTLGPLQVVFGEGYVAFVALAAAAIMTFFDVRTFTDYGLPMDQAFGKRFWQGLSLGFGMLSLLLAGIWALHGFSLDGLAVSGGTAVKYGLLWAVAFFLTGVFEDFTFRGYLQSALGDGIGFWPAALILAVVFGAIHWNNQGEALFGCVMAGLFGLLEAFALWRTGNLWLLFGMHASWDWGETYFYGTPDSGLLATGHLFNSSFHGAEWLTGGTVGPEGSWLVFLVLVIWALVIHVLFPRKQVAT